MPRRPPLAVIFIAAFCALKLATAQPLAGGGGGGGGGGFDDGGSLFDDSDDGPSCPPHCYSCSRDNVCDTCYEGYVRMGNGSCVQCPRGCKKCDVHGPNKCDECHSRHVLVSPMFSRRCEPCSDHCMQCDVAGPGACDDGQCDWGYVRDSKLMVCEACTSHCGKCVDTSASGCLKCKIFYKLSEGSCNLDVWFLTGMSLVFAIVVSILCYVDRRFGSNNRGAARNRGATRYAPVPTHEAYISQFLTELAGSGEGDSQRLLPSGVWRGYYTHSGARHDVCEFSFEFRPNGSVSGSGVDDVGKYTIGGLCNNSASRLAFTKTYVRRSQNVSGVVSYGNQGHSVEYRGELVTGAGGALGGGFRGDWAIRHEIGNDNGAFHLWPAMDGWQEPEAEASTEHQQTFERESECVVCFDRPITTSLRLCGHQVLCRECADLLRSPPKCPICRANITTICNVSTGGDKKRE